MPICYVLCTTAVGKRCNPARPHYSSPPPPLLLLFLLLLYVPFASKSCPFSLYFIQAAPAPAPVPVPLVCSGRSCCCSFFLPNHSTTSAFIWMWMMSHGMVSVCGMKRLYSQVIHMHSARDGEQLRSTVRLALCGPPRPLLRSSL